VRDDDARDLGLREPMRAALRQLAPGGEVHVLAIELCDLLAWQLHIRASGRPASRSCTPTSPAR
jgi:hypothetical protein